MILTEEKQQQTEELALLFIEQACYSEFQMTLDEGDTYQASDEDYIALETTIDYFVQNFKQPTINEAIEEAHSGFDINEPLYDALYEAVVDESIGSFVAGAVHGLGSSIAHKKAASATQAANKATTKKKSNTTKTKVAGSNMKSVATRAFAKARSKHLAAKETKAKANAGAKQQAAFDKHNKRADMATKIDNHVNNIKTAVKSKWEKIKQAVKDKAHSVASAAANKVGNIAGRIANKVS